MPTKNPTAAMKRRWNLSSRYGLTPEQYAEIMSRNGGVCGICGGKPARPVLDHCHKTGKVRGVLCHGCNIKLPAVEDATFRAAALAYLERMQ